MPRGRAGLAMIPAQDVRAALHRRWHTVQHVAKLFGVTDRTVRRWLTTGLALYFGETYVTRDEWQLYVDNGDPLRSTPVRTSRRGQVSKVHESPTAPHKPTPRPRPGRDSSGRALTKRKKLRTSRELREQWKARKR